jgi:hypothetical protein
MSSPTTPSTPPSESIASSPTDSVPSEAPPKARPLVSLKSKQKKSCQRSRGCRWQRLEPRNPRRRSCRKAIAP